MSLPRNPSSRNPSPRNPQAVYIVIAAGMWLSIITAIASVLRGTPYLPQVLLILLGGAVVFVVLLPMVWRVPPTPSRRG